MVSVSGFPPRLPGASYPFGYLSGAAVAFKLAWALAQLHCGSEKVTQRLKGKNLVLVLDAKAKDFLVEKGYDPTYGARPMRRSVERYLEDPLAEELLKGNLHEGEPVEVTAEGDKLVFSQKAAPAAGTEATLSS